MSSALRLSLVVTSINKPNRALREFAIGCGSRGIRFILIGDEKSPTDFHLNDCEYLSIPAQLSLGYEFAALCPTRHYARKNIGYLVALKQGAEIIIETDDDNYPLDTFWNPRVRKVDARQVVQPGWSNIYRHFTEAYIWPRGLPLDEIRAENAILTKRHVVDSPIQQSLVNQNPDVDALYRLTQPLPQSFEAAPPVALARNAWCPFNSQNTTWWRDSAALLYLPSYCSFRMTDIWRSFIAQRIAWECGWSVSFHPPTAYQERNQHNLMADFADEVPGYLGNRKFADLLERLELAKGRDNIGANIVKCYEMLVRESFFPKDELALVGAWVRDIEQLANK